MNNIGDFLEQRVWPELDAAAAGLLDDLSPTRRQDYYSLTCPSCHKRRAFYYPRGSIRCNRIEACDYRSTVWRYLREKGIPKRDILQQVCDAVGVSPPQQASLSPQQSLDHKLKRLLMAGFKDARSRIRDKWNYSEDQLNFLAERCGYYESSNALRRQLNPDEIKLAEESGWLAKSSVLDDRLVGFWRQPDGSLRLWGRALADQTPKYYYATTLSKAAPYLVNECAPGSPLLAVEGGRDVLALRIMGFSNACGTGGNLLNYAQARFLADRYDEIVYVTDGDIAGMKGIVATTQNCRAFGITPRFAIIPSGESLDPDKYREVGRENELRQIIEKPHDCGTALALTYVALCRTPGESSTIQRILSLRPDISTSDRVRFDQTLAGYGINMAPEHDAVRDLSVLMKHFTFEKSNELLARKYGFTFELIRAENNG